MIVATSSSGKYERLIESSPEFSEQCSDPPLTKKLELEAAKLLVVACRATSTSTAQQQKRLAQCERSSVIDDAANDATRVACWLVCCCCVVWGGARGREIATPHYKKLQKTLKACARGHEICPTVRSENRVQWRAPHVCSNLYDHCHTLSR